MDLKNILTVLDKPKHDQQALKRTLDLLEHSSGQAHLVSFCWNSAYDNRQVLDRLEREKLKAAERAARQTWLDALLAKQAPGLNVRGETVFSKDISGWICATAERKVPDLVIKSVHQTHSLTHTSTDWELLRNCPAPLWLTATKPRKQSGNVLAAIDLANNDATHRRLNRRVLQAAHQVAELRGAQVHVVFSVEISPVLRDLDIVDERVSKARILREVTPELEKLLSPYSVAKSRIHTPVGKVSRTVTQIARKVRADVLVLGSHAHRLKQMVGLGNSAQRILEHAVCDVLAVHPS